MTDNKIIYEFFWIVKEQRNEWNAFFGIYFKPKQPRLPSLFNFNVLNEIGQTILIFVLFCFREHELRVIRPFVYVREKALRQYSTNENLPVVTCSSSPKLSKERQRVRQLLTQQEILFPKLFTSLRAALHPLIGFEIRQCETKFSKRSTSKDSDESEAETDEEPVIKIDKIEHWSEGCDIGLQK